MFRKIIIATAIFILLTAVGAKGRETAVSAQSPTGDILTLVNQLRASYGLPPFSYNPQLAAAAQAHANWMSETAIYSHTGAGGSSPQTRANAAGYPGYVSENIVGGTNLNPGGGVTWWRNSSIHFATMISNKHTQAGVGFAQGNDQNFYVLVVGYPSDKPPETAVREETVNYVDAPFFVEPIAVNPPNEDGSIVHVLGEGHTLWAISARYEVPIWEILLYNGLTEDSVIRPGDTLTIRLADGAEPPPTPTPPAHHIVKRGDNSWSIAAWYNISLADFLWYNSMGENDMLQPGDEVKIRLVEGEAPPPTPTPQLAHIVESGDSFWSIAVRYNLSLDELLSYNGLNEGSFLGIGDEIFIVSPTPPATPTLVPSETPVVMETAVATSTPFPTPNQLMPSPTPLQVAALAVTPPASSSQTNSGVDDIIGIGVMAFGVGLLLVAIVGVVYLRKA
ncbi:MAG: LysM peptidoglycan-binding domain-containing protein [Anaerolineae bacterium]|nr:LysM peptidoglycan-binding domain-containing protein [Anaerolineae bacterium]